jgi:polysaccharide export outer membrane protein
MGYRLGFSGTLIGLCLVIGLLGGCAGDTALPSSGPSVKQVTKSSIPVIGIDGAVAERVRKAKQRHSFSETLARASEAGKYVVGPGDSLGVTIWEAPPATLFGSTTLSNAGGLSTSQTITIPEQMVAADGTIEVPFAGQIVAAGKSPQQIQLEIVSNLAEKANHPQALVRVSRNVTSNVAIMGEVGTNTMLPLTDKGERLLDALAMVGGVKGPVTKASIQVSRGDRQVSMPLSSIIADPRQNIFLQPGDVVTSLIQSNDFTVLGAAGKNGEIPFEAAGISLAEALGRIGGVQDTAADSRGLFLFRFEDAAAMPKGGQDMPRTEDGKVPVIYQLDLKNPASFLVAQNFPIDDKDVIYVSTAPVVELQKFLNILAPTLSAAAFIITVAP